MSYNVENLFDYFDDSTKNDNQYLPTSNLYWTKSRFELKVKRIAQVIVGVGGQSAPEIVGLCEIENDFCLRALTEKSILSRLDYKFIHYESNDARGIDVALLYRESKFIPIKSQAITIKSNKKIFTTREILYVKGLSKTLNDTLHIFVNHWPSRLGGKSKSEYKRIAAAKTLRTICDSIFTDNTNAKIIIMGDFNDEPDNISISQTLAACNSAKYDCDKSDLIRLAPINGHGTHKYNGIWAYLDNIIISKSLLDKYTPQVKIYDIEPLLTDDNKGIGKKPWRTYQGIKYIDGFSDHLPIFLQIKIE